MNDTILLVVIAALFAAVIIDAIREGRRRRKMSKMTAEEAEAKLIKRVAKIPTTTLGESFSSSEIAKRSIIYMQYTDDKIKCSKCGKISLSSSRYCEICGNKLLIPLDSPKIKSEEFINIFNSAYSLLANKQNPDRTKYIVNSIDDAIFKRGKDIYKQLWKHVIEYRIGFKGLGEPFDRDIEPLILYESKYSSSTTLAGYAFRIAEELYTQKTTNKISEININELINNYKKNYADKNDQTETKLVMLCYALCHDENYLNYNLIN